MVILHITKHHALYIAIIAFIKRLFLSLFFANATLNYIFQFGVT